MSFSPSQIKDLSGRVYFITGGTAGLGAQSIKILATKSPKHIFFSGRSQSKADSLISEIKKSSQIPITFIQCDLTDLSSVKQSAQSLISSTDRLDVLYCNAGIMGNLPGLTNDGYELQFGTNHVGHALLIKLLLPLLLKTAEQPNSDVRIINMSSVAYTQAPKQGIAFETLKTNQDGLGGMIPGPRWCRYGQSKLANLLYARELAQRYPSIKTVSVHPGYIKTDIFANATFLMKLPLRVMIPLEGGWTSIEEGPYNQLWAGTTDKANLEGGAYYIPIAKKGELKTTQSRDDALARRLWDWTQKELEAF